MTNIKYTNNNNTPLALAVWLCNDTYDHDDDPMQISATSLIKSIRQIILTSRVESKIIDVSALVNSAMGTAIHDSCENAWRNPEAVKKGMAIAGYPQKIIDKVRINPVDSSDDIIPVYLEQRVEKVINGYRVSGKFDIVMDGELQDYKSTSTFTYMDQSNAEKYVLQGSIYRYLNPDIITAPTLQINYIFTDWSFAQARQNKSYPQSRVLSQTFQLMSKAETESYIKNKLQQIDLYRAANLHDIPLCSKEDLWMGDPVFKYYKNPANRARSTKNFTNMTDAYAFKAKNGNVGEIVEVPSKAKACNYCAARDICNQAADLQAANLL